MLGRMSLPEAAWNDGVAGEAAGADPMLSDGPLAAGRCTARWRCFVIDCPRADVTLACLTKLRPCLRCGCRRGFPPLGALGICQRAAPVGTLESASNPPKRWEVGMCCATARPRNCGGISPAHPDAQPYGPPFRIRTDKRGKCGYRWPRLSSFPIAPSR